MGKYGVFEGKWQVSPRTHPNSSDVSKEGYYPQDTTVVVQFVKADFTSQHPTTGQTVKGYRVVVKQGSWAGAAGVQAAFLFYRSGRLISTPITTGLQGADPGSRLSFTMFIEMTDEDNMKSYLGWSDGDFGCWGCRRL